MNAQIFCPPFRIEIRDIVPETETAPWIVFDLAATKILAEAKLARMKDSKNLESRLVENAPVLSASPLAPVTDAEFFALMAQRDDLQRRIEEIGTHRALLVAEAGTDDIALLAAAMRVTAGLQTLKAQFPKGGIPPEKVAEFAGVPKEFFVKFQPGDQVVDVNSRIPVVVGNVTENGFEYLYQGGTGFCPNENAGDFYPPDQLPPPPVPPEPKKKKRNRPKKKPGAKPVVPAVS